MLVTAKNKRCELRERTGGGAPVCPLLCCRKFDGGHFEWHWRVPPKWAAIGRGEEREEKRSRERWGRFYIKRKDEESTDSWCWYKRSSPLQTVRSCIVLICWDFEGVQDCLPWAVFTGRQYNQMYKVVYCVCLSLFLLQHLTHRAWYVRAGCPLAVGACCGCASDFLLLPQQLTVLLLPVLHVDQQRNEAVLHLFITKSSLTSNWNLHAFCSYK